MKITNLCICNEKFRQRTRQLIGSHLNKWKNDIINNRYIIYINTIPFLNWKYLYYFWFKILKSNLLLDEVREVQQVVHSSSTRHSLTVQKSKINNSFYFLFCDFFDTKCRETTNHTMRKHKTKTKLINNNYQRHQTQPRQHRQQCLAYACVTLFVQYSI